MEPKYIVLLIIITALLIEIGAFISAHLTSKRKKIITYITTGCLIIISVVIVYICTNTKQRSLYEELDVNDDTVITYASTSNSEDEKEYCLVCREYVDVDTWLIHAANSDVMGLLLTTYCSQCGYSPLYSTKEEAEKHYEELREDIDQYIKNDEKDLYLERRDIDSRIKEEYGKFFN